MKKTEDTSRQAGLVPRICSAGRTVAAVICAAPQTRPSTSPCLSIMVPTVIGVGQVLAGHLHAPALGPPQLRQRGDVALGDGSRVHDGDAAGQAQPDVPGLRGDLVRRAQQQATDDAAFGARDRAGPGRGPAPGSRSGSCRT